MCRPLHANLTSLSLDVVKLLDSYRSTSRELATEAGEVAKNINRVSWCGETFSLRVVMKPSLVAVWRVAMHPRLVSGERTDF